MTNLIQKIINFKNNKKIVCLTAYSYPIAKIIDNYCDIILVGDSLGMCIYGHQDTTNTSLTMMINHGKAVKNACKNALIVVDMPINTYENSPQEALKNAKEIIKQTECHAIKIEVTSNLIETAKYLCQNNINVMGHIGLLPQHVKSIGGYKYQGRDHETAKIITQTALDLEKAGVFSVVIEAVPSELASSITQKLKIPTIGIGASLDCDGQILVIDDLIGLNQEFKPKFVTHYAQIALDIDNAVKKFADDVKNSKFPQKTNLL